MKSVYDKTLEEFRARCLDNPLLKPLVNDIGIQEIIKSIAYSQQQKLDEYLVALSEIANPRSEKMLLYMTMTKLGHLKLQEPLKIKYKSSKKLDKFTELTSGADMYLTISEDVAIFGQVRHEKFSINGGVFTKYDLDCTYRELVDTELSFNGKILKRSQKFKDDTADYMLEISPKNTMVLVVRNGINLKSGDEVDVSIITSKISTNIPNRLSVINDNSISITGIELLSPPIPYDSTKQLREMLKYG